MKKTLVILFSLLLTVNAFAERNVLFDYLAAQNQNFNIANSVKYVPKGVGLGTLDGTFGVDITPIKNLLRSGKFDFYRVHFINGPGLNNNRPARHEITYGYTNASFAKAVKDKNPKIIGYYKARVRAYCDLMGEFPSVKFSLSPILESRMPNETWKTLAEITKETCKKDYSLTFNSLISFDPPLPALKETHSNFPKKGSDISSLDGSEASDININEWWERTKREKYTGVWTRSYNCNTQGIFVNPIKRKACPTETIFEEMAHIVNDRGQAPRLETRKCAKRYPFSGGTTTWKPLAEDGNVPDKRSNKPVALLALKGTDAQVIDYKGNGLGKLPYYGPYTVAGYHRYYSAMGANLQGYEFEKKARQKSGYPYTWLKVGDSCYGPLIMGKRQGTYR